MAFTLTQLAALEDAIASGQRRVRYDGKEVEYDSMEALIKVRNLVRGELLATGQLSEATPSNRGPSSLAVFTRD